VALPDRAGSARWLGRVFEFAVVTAGIACAASVAVGSVLEVLGSPLEEVGAALARPPG
jgi:hypothetical protein